MNRQSIVQAACFAILVGAGVMARMAFEYLPNFAPVAALALFAGYFFRHWLVAIMVPLSVMAISDWFIGGYHPVMMASVYTMLAAPVALRGALRNRLRLEGAHIGSTLGSITGLAGCSVASSLAFFAVTNFSTWLVSGMYPPTSAGLFRCYVAAIPFFRYTLAGDLVFAVLLFGGYALALRIAYLRNSALMRLEAESS